MLITFSVSPRLIQLGTTLSVCYLSVSCGTFLGYTSSAIPSMQEDPLLPDLSTHDISWIGGLGPLGAFCGALLAAIVLRFLGPRGTICYACFPATLASWILMMISSSVELILVARFIGGIGAGIVTACAPLYVMGIAAPANRGRLGVLPQLLMLVGILISYCLGNMMNWRTHAMVCLGITALALIHLPFSLDTPPWLLAHGQKEAALNVLESLNDKSAAFTELNRIETQLLAPDLGLKKRLCNSVTLKSVGVALGIMTFQQFSGVNGITFYAVAIFQKTSSAWGSHLPTILLGAVQVTASLTSTQLIDRVGRRVLLIASAFITGVSCAVLGLYFYSLSLDENLFWIPLLAITIFSFGFGIGFGPVAWILVSELLPERLRQSINPIIMAYNWLCTFAVTKSFPLLLPPIQIFGIFWLYAGCSFVGLIFVIFLVPETKGKSPAELANVFMSKSATLLANSQSNSNGVQCDRIVTIA